LGRRLVQGLTRDKDREETTVVVPAVLEAPEARVKAGVAVRAVVEAGVVVLAAALAAAVAAALASATTSPWAYRF
jgi:hypothetical protein